MFSQKKTALKCLISPLSNHLISLMSISLSMGFSACDEPSGPVVDMATPIDQSRALDQEFDIAPPPPRCGDGVINQPTEACDDGNREDGDDCTQQCQESRCGDGYLHQGVEVCDDGNDITSDACNTCELATCGDGVMRTDLPLFHTDFEECDDGNQDDSDGCTRTCKRAICGDGLLQEGVEECDDGNQDNRDQCSTECTIAECGDGVVQLGVEECDDGNQDNRDQCLTDCTIAECGDGFLHADREECDEGAMNGNQSRCTSGCLRGRCGDGLLLSGLPANDPRYEECDDGNTSNTDLCTNLCTLARCGDGVLREGEEACDDGNLNDGDGCDSSCALERCGNGIIQPGAGEECDDGNLNNGDECTQLCRIAQCGDGIVQQGVEDCDLGERNADEPDLCRTDCTLPFCGDEIRDERLGEECDGGREGDDECRSTCVLKRCGDGVVDEGEDCDDGNQNINDACVNCESARCGDGVLWLGEEECDEGASNASAPDQCRETCRLPRCGDGIKDTGERCDDEDEDDFNGCDRHCDISWCGNGNLDTYALRTIDEECDDPSSQCLVEECEPSLSSDCDQDCSARDYDLITGQRVFRYQAARLSEFDRYYFEISSASFAHFAARQSDIPLEFCATLREMTLVQIDDEGLEEVVEGLDPSGAFVDQGLCGVSQANLEPGKYRLDVSGEGEERVYYDLTSSLSQEITGRGTFPTQLVVSNEEPRDVLAEEIAAKRSLFHLYITEEDLEENNDDRRIRLILHSDHLKEGVDLLECPTLQLHRDQDRQDIRDLERPSALIPVDLSSPTDVRDQSTCIYEATLSRGLYHLTIPLEELPFESIIYQWASTCGDGVIDDGESCDVNEPTSLQGRYTCSRVCQIDPPNTPNDNICDASEVDSEGDGDCLETCGDQASPSCAQEWSEASLYQRNVHARDIYRVLDFELKYAQTVQASLGYCTESSLSLSIVDDEGEVVISDSEGGRDRCAYIDQQLEPGHYSLVIAADPTEDGSRVISYLLEALRFQSLDHHQLMQSMTHSGADRELTRAFEINVQEGESYRLRVFDNDRTLQCESRQKYSVKVSSLEITGSIQRTADGELVQEQLNTAEERYSDDLTASFSEDVPCYETMLIFETGRYILDLSSLGEGQESEVEFFIQALNPSLCGNHVVDDGEECDDGNLTSDDGCTKYCLKEPNCGDGVVDRGEECDDGNRQDGDLSCSSQCTRCGDGLLAEGEQCDDGNTINGDGCDLLCSSEVIEVIHAVSHYRGRVLQSKYRERSAEIGGATLDIDRNINERSDLYIVDLSKKGVTLESGLDVVLCAQLNSSTDDTNISVSPDVLKDQLQTTVKLISIDNGQSPQAAVQLNEAAEADTISLVTSETPLLDLERCGEELLPSEPQPTLSLATSEQRQRWHERDDLTCLKMRWDNQSLNGKYALVVEANEQWQLYRDHPLEYDLNLMTWSTLWSSEAVGLGIATGQIKPNGDALFKLTRPPGALSNLYEARTLESDHFSCPIHTETAITLLTPNVDTQECHIYSRLSEDSSCASTRAILEDEGDYYFLVRSREPTTGLNRFGFKLRSVEACGDHILDWGEECDDGNRNNNDECSKVCTNTYLQCGNGVLDVGEECDDGNQMSDDGCDEVCENERDTLWLNKSQLSDLTPPLVAQQVSAVSEPRYTFIKYPVNERDVNGDETPLEGDFWLNLTPAEGYELTYKLCSDGEENDCAIDSGECQVNMNLSDIDGESPIEGEEGFNACTLSMNLALSEESEPVDPPYHLSYHRRYNLNKSMQIYGRLQPFASDMFEINLSEIKTNIGKNISSIIMKAMVTAESISEFVASDEPPCSEALDPLLTLYDSRGNVILENDDFTATNLCPSIFSILNVQSQGAGGDPQS